MNWLKEIKKEPQTLTHYATVRAANTGGTPVRDGRAGDAEDAK